MKRAEKLKFHWPETGELTVKIRGNESATLRFTPSPAAIEAGLRKATQKPVYDDESDRHPHTNGE